MESVPIPVQPSSNGNDSTVTNPASASRFGLKTDRSCTQHGDLSNDNESPATSSITSPPYWVHAHTRSFSNISVESIPDGTIILRDNTDGEDVKNKACWARSVYIEGYVIVNGSRTGIGAFVTWNITVETLNVSLFVQVLSVKY